jgi:hypothetical protein
VFARDEEPHRVARHRVICKGNAGPGGSSANRASQRVICSALARQSRAVPVSPSCRARASRASQ